MKFFIGLTLFIASSLVSAQSLDVRWGEPIKTITEFSEIIGFSSDTLYLESDEIINPGVGAVLRKPALSAVSTKSLEIIYTEQIKLPKVNGEKVELFDIILLNKGLVALGFSTNTSKTSMKVYGFPVSKNGNVNPQANLLLDISDNDAIINQNVFIEFSKDKSKFILVYMRLAESSSEFRAETIVYNSDVELISTRSTSRVFLRKNKNKDLFNISILLNNDGSYLTSVEETIFSKDKLPDYSFTIKEINEFGELEIEKTIRFNERGLYKPYMFFSEDGETFQVIGFYSDLNDVKLKLGGYSGIYSATVSTKTFEVLEKKISPFSDEILAKVYSEKELKKQKKKGKGLPLSENFKIRAVTPTLDDGFLIQAEYYSKVYSKYTGGQLDPKTTYQFGDVVVLKLSSNGEIEWEQVLYKQQFSIYSVPVTKTNNYATGTKGEGYSQVSYSPVSSTTRTSAVYSFMDAFFKVDKEPRSLDYWSYVSFLGDEEFIILFNDSKSHPANDKNHKMHFSLKKYQVYKVTFDIISGEMKKEYVGLDVVPENEVIEAGSSIKVSESEVVLVTYKKGYNRIGVVTIK
ncbi:MAG: hypothetical protein ACJA2N_001611 [Salibacteraceae bacterium]|jgi:hypothetical protein